MGLVYADIELINTDDVALARRHIIGEDEIRSIKIRALVDTGSVYMAINENIQQVLQLPVVGKRTGILANGHRVECDVVALEVRFGDCRSHCSAMVLPEDSEPLLGAIPLEDMNVMVHPQKQELIVNPKHVLIPSFKIFRHDGTIPL